MTPQKKTMKGNKHMKTITNITYPAFALFAFACFALPPQARATCQQGCVTSTGNTFLGDDALINNTSGHENTAIGNVALLSNTTGSANTAVGSETLEFNTTGIENTAIGTVALKNNTTASFNTAIGSQALSSNTTGDSNTATGHTALTSNTIGYQNTANGSEALISDTEGYGNVGIGFQALNANTTGSSNIALGVNAGLNLTTGDNNIDIGNLGVAAESNTIRIGTQGTQTRTFIAGISGTAVTGRPVVINANGKLGTPPSSARFKDGIKPMDRASEAILALKPVTFRYKKEIDPDRTTQFGLVAEQVEKVNPDLVAHDKKGKPYTVRYDAVNAMLLNEFLKEHRRVQEQEATIAELKSSAVKQEMINAQQQSEIKTLAATLREQASQIQKVSAQLELAKAPAQTVVNNR